VKATKHLSALLLYLVKFTNHLVKATKYLLNSTKRLVRLLLHKNENSYMIKILPGTFRPALALPPQAVKNLPEGRKFHL
jgi:hypothetical protein